MTRIFSVFSTDSAAEVARKIGVKRQTVQGWKAGRSAPTLQHLAEVIRVTGCDGSWLLTGEGHSGVSGPTPEQLAAVASLQRVIDKVQTALDVALTNPEAAKRAVDTAETMEKSAEHLEASMLKLPNLS